MNQHNASAEYISRLAARKQTLEVLDTRHRQYGNAKVALLLVIIVAIWLAEGPGLFSALWIILPAALFLVMLVRHEAVINQRNMAIRAVALYKDGADRIAGRWAGRGSSGTRFRSFEHPYSEDLDLYGPGSLFELVCAARTREGEEMLAGWLGSPGDIAEVRGRQAAVLELVNRLDLREDIALLGARTSEIANLERLRKWAGVQLAPSQPAAAWFAIGITALSITAAIYAATGYSRIPLELSVLCGQIFAFTRRKADSAAASGTEKSVQDLEILSDVLIRLEKESFKSPALAQLTERLSCGDELPSQRIAALIRIVAWKDAMRSNLFVIIGIALLWNTHSALALERWRRKNGEQVPVWIETVAAFEAISSLSRFAYEQDGVTMPELVELEAVFEAVALKHPLVQRGHAVANSVSLNAASALFIVSGSNMSGKSTLLRTIGINTALALAGAPVCAESMRLGPLHVGASLRAGDSLQAGVSRFYAEIQRLRQIVDIARDTPPALFLLDEILHGTNSHDRTVGAEAVIRALLAAGAIGLVTTHDLALARIADDTALHAVNVHFQDEMIDGKMVFDYHLRPGIVTRSNAIPLMRAVGLDV